MCVCVCVCACVGDEGVRVTADCRLGVEGDSNSEPDYAQTDLRQNPHFLGQTAAARKRVLALVQKLASTLQKANTSTVHVHKNAFFLYASRAIDTVVCICSDIKRCNILTLRK